GADLSLAGHGVGPDGGGDRRRRRGEEDRARGEEGRVRVRRRGRRRARGRRGRARRVRGHRRRERLMRSRVAACVVATSLLVVGGCTIPHERADLELTKQAVTSDEVDRIFERYREVRNAAIELLDPKPLSVVESGA